LEVDIAVDLKGHTDNARTGIFMFRPAPIQVNYLGYPGTMGAGFIDYIVADKTVLPEDHRQHYSEKVVYLPHSYQANDSKKVISPAVPGRTELGLPGEGFVFCCFNNSYKIEPQVFDIWMRLLGRVAGSVLWLLQSNDVAVANLRREAEARGIAGERLVFSPAIELSLHLARLQQADLFLDTFSCNAHTTASDALWAGLPVLTRLGETFASRVAASLLTAAGVPELITHSAEDYEALALALATEPTRLSEIHERLGRQRSVCPLFDTTGFTQDLEAAYSRMMAIFHQGLAPQPITIE
jgi:protein O-GlcNAc transferase